MLALFIQFRLRVFFAVCSSSELMLQEVPEVRREGGVFYDLVLERRILNLTDMGPWGWDVIRVSHLLMLEESWPLNIEQSCVVY